MGWKSYFENFPIGSFIYPEIPLYRFKITPSALRWGLTLNYDHKSRVRLRRNTPLLCSGDSPSQRFLFYNMATQINLKFQDDFFKLAKSYADSRGYMSIQELVRDALREKIFDDLEVRDEYKRVLQSKEASRFTSI